MITLKEIKLEQKVERQRREALADLSILSRDIDGCEKTKVG